MHAASPQNEQAAVRPSLLRAPGGHTISRRSAAEGGADAPLMPSKAARRTACTLTNASHHLSGGSTAVMRAECTAARLLARWHHEPTRQEQQEAAGEAGEDRGRPTLMRRVRDLRISRWRFGVNGTSILKEKGVLAPKFSSPAARL